MRRATLASRFLLILLVSGVVPLVLYGWFSLRALRQQIDAQAGDVWLPQLAAEHAARIDGRLDQIQQACAVVREIARRVLDGSEPAAAFTTQTELLPDLLDNFLDLLLLARPDGEVVLWQDGQRLDGATHGQRAALIPRRVDDTGWFARAQRQGGAFFLPLQRSPYLCRSSDQESHDPAAWHLGYVIDVPAGKGPPGALLLLIRWTEVQAVLDHARTTVAAAGLPSAEALLVDADGRVAAADDRARYGERLATPELLAALPGAAATRIAFTDAAGRRRSAGLARVGGGEHRTWTLLLTAAHDELFARSDAFARVLGLAIAAAVLLLVAWSLAASRAVARPVRELVAATDRVARGDLTVRVPAGGGRELDELAAAFNRMAADLTASRQRLAGSEREKAWAEMARQVAHEIKNPLTPMRTAAQLLLRARRDADPRADAIAERLARTVQEQTEVLDRIAAGFRQFAGSPQRQFETVRLDDLLADAGTAAASLFEGGTVRLDAQPGAGDAVVAVDRRELGRVLLNLVQNAAQAQPTGVRVHIATAREGERATIRVEDDGPGIPADVQARLFEPYFTTKSSGTGLGLAICRRIVEAHGGTIRLESTAPGRTVFRIELPLARG